MLNFNIDHLVLGCTHYPYLIPQIKEILGSSINIIDSGEAVAKQTKAVLGKYNLVSTSKILGNHQLLINSTKEVLEQLIKEVTANYAVHKLDF